MNAACTHGMPEVNSLDNTKRLYMQFRQTVESRADEPDNRENIPVQFWRCHPVRRLFFNETLIQYCFSSAAEELIVGNLGSAKVFALDGLLFFGIWSLGAVQGDGVAMDQLKSQFESAGAGMFEALAAVVSQHVPCACLNQQDGHASRDQV